MGILLAIGVSVSTAQNLVPNPSFENYTTCPDQAGNGDLECIPWQTIAPGHADYFHACGTAGLYSVPFNFIGTQNAYTGEAYTGIYYKILGNVYREYLQIFLSETLQGGSCYQIGFHYSLAEDGCAVNQMGMLLSAGAVTNPVGLTPQLNWSGQFYGGYNEWHEVITYITAVGNENCLTIGNFYGDAQTAFDPDCIYNPALLSYYYIDDVFVNEITPSSFTFNLGAPVTACYEYTIDPMLPGVEFEWSDGSVGPTLVVTESGEYSVTATYACSSVESSVEITILGYEEIDIGPPILELCSGTQHTILLDPSLGTYEWQDGSSATEYTITDPGIYYVILSNDCITISDTLQVLYISQPEPFTLGQDTFICSGDPLVFAFDPDLGQFEWQDNDPSPMYAITQEGTYSLTISNDCGEESASIEVIEIPDPDVMLDDDVELCSGDQLEIVLDPAAGSYLWQDGSTDYEYTIFEAGYYSVTLTNECGMTTEDILVTTLLPLLPPTLDDTISICPGEVVVVSVATTGAMYSWSDGSSADSLLISVPGTYMVTISNDCDSFIDTVTVMENHGPPLFQLPADFTFCDGNTVVLTAPVDNAQYVWNTGSTMQSISIDTAGLYSVTVSTLCGSHADTIMLSNAGMAPVVWLGADTSICNGTTLYVIPSFENVTTWQWHDGSSSDTFAVSSPDTIIIMAGNNCGMVTDSMVVSVLPPVPVLNLGPDITLCPGESMSINILEPDVDIIWFDGTTDSLFTVSAAGLITASISNACGTSNDTVIATILPAIPSLNLGPDQTLCPGETIVFDPGIPDVSYLWQDNSTGMSFTAMTEGIYHLTISGVCGQASDTVIITESSEGPQIDLGPDITGCESDEITLNAGIDGVSYNWSDGTSGPSITVSVSGTYSLTVSNACGTAIDSIVVTLNNIPPVVALGPDIFGCVGQSFIIDAGISGSDYLWQDGSTGSSYIVNVSETIILQVSNACGTDSDTLLAFLNGVSPVASLGPDTSICEGTSFVVTVSVDPGTSILWQDGSSPSQYVINTEGLYILELSNACGVSSDSFLVNLIPPPAAFDLGPDTTLCPGESLLLLAPVTSDFLSWQDGSGGNTFLADAAQTYSLMVSNDCGTSMDFLTVDFSEDIPVIVFDTELFLCPEQFVILDATQSFPAEYLWSTGGTAPSISVTSPGYYSVSVQSSCFTGEAGTTITAGLSCGDVSFYIPNVFSPNDDQVNDIFEVYTSPGTEILSLQGFIYDRWGNLLFQSTTIPFSWGGDMNGAIMNPGVYVYRIAIEYTFGGEVKKEILSGDITLIH